MIFAITGGNIVEFRDLRKQYRVLKEAIDQSILETIKDGHYILGPQVNQLEAELGEFTGSNHCICCGNGTDALILALMAWNIGPGDAVFVPDFTCFASVTCIMTRGAEPIFVDIDIDTFNMDPDSLGEAISDVINEGRLRPRVIMPVDLFGLPANYSKIRELAKEHSLYVLEDAAQSFGASIDGRRTCTFGDISTTSFFPSKPFGCYGDGGAIFTDSRQTADLLRSMRFLGRSVEDQYDNINIGLNSRLDTLQAVVLSSKLEYFKNYEICRVNRIADSYSSLLEKVVSVPRIPDGYYSSWAQYTILLENESERDALKDHLGGLGIPTMVYYPRPMHRQKACSGLSSAPRVSLKNSLLASERVLSLPMHPYLTDDEIDIITSAIIDYLG